MNLPAARVHSIFRKKKAMFLSNVVVLYQLDSLCQVQYDMVTACYTLGDLASDSIEKLSIAALWRKTKKYLVH